MIEKNGVVLVLSGPSGAGKSSLINKISDDIGDYYFSISTTTRPPREGEKEGVHYHFVSEEEFKNDIKDNYFLEHALVHGNYYGTSLKPVKEALEEGKLVIFDIDVQGHRLVRAKMGDFVTSAFITPPTLKELEKRLYARATDDISIIERRVENAKEEITAVNEFDFVIINDEIPKASAKFATIANAARLKQNSEELENFIKIWDN